MKWSCVCLWPAGVVWSPDEGVAALAGCSDRPAEEEGDGGQTAVGQQARQTAAGQRGDRWGKNNSGQHQHCDNNICAGVWCLVLFFKIENNVWVMNEPSYCSQNAALEQHNSHLFCPGKKVLKYWMFRFFSYIQNLPLYVWQSICINHFNQTWALD